ncbi:unnamed protein product [Cylicocyclus nassatus]|uniref:Uncharacterized protein n=1 Tax=Cylicocyclus nassatus TaxID=53992 RepID=A0AA36GXR7_CYLNA|nr:unnamed protein product [Cylicocyclus nassatus]
MQPYTACVQIDRVKILVCGDKGVGKTALIHAFRDDTFTEDPEETGEMVCKMHYVDDKRVLFQMVELHTDDLSSGDAHNAQAIMLLFDNEATTTLRRIQTFWYSKINLYFSQVPLFLVRSKCDLRTKVTPIYENMLKNSMHAMRYLECSAKQMNGVRYVFFEILGAVRATRRDQEQEYPNTEYTTSQAVGEVATRIISSGPLLRQVFVNARECLTNPAAFPDVKQSLSSLLPFNIFGTEPIPEVNNNNTVRRVTDSMLGMQKKTEKDDEEKQSKEKEQ